MASIETTTGAIAGAGASMTTLVIGAQVDALVVGLLAAFFTSIWLSKIDNCGRAAAAVLFSTLLAAYGSPVAAEYIATNVTGIQTGEPLRLLLALLIGALSPHLVPLAVRYAQGRIIKEGNQ